MHAVARHADGARARAALPWSRPTHTVECGTSLVADATIARRARLPPSWEHRGSHLNASSPPNASAVSPNSVAQIGFLPPHAAGLLPRAGCRALTVRPCGRSTTPKLAATAGVQTASPVVPQRCRHCTHHADQRPNGGTSLAASEPVESSAPSAVQLWLPQRQRHHLHGCRGAPCSRTPCEAASVHWHLCQRR